MVTSWHLLFFQAVAALCVRPFEGCLTTSLLLVLYWFNAEACHLTERTKTKVSQMIQGGRKHIDFWAHPAQGFYDDRHVLRHTLRSSTNVSRTPCGTTSFFHCIFLVTRSLPYAHMFNKTRMRKIHFEK